MNSAELPARRIYDQIYFKQGASLITEKVGAFRRSKPDCSTSLLFWIFGCHFPTYDFITPSSSPHLISEVFSVMRTTRSIFPVY